jgi:hypothetical protein
MADLTAQRTLVKSPPELWSELSEVESLARHLGELGEIRIVKVEPESTVAWEGEEVSGTVELEQSGWGTKVTFRATVPESGPAAEPIAPEPVELAPVAAEPVEATPEPAVPEPPAAFEDEPAEAAAGEAAEAKRPGFLARWLFRRRQPLPEPIATEQQPTAAVVVPEPEPMATAAAPEPEAVAVEQDPEPEPVAGSDAVDRVQQVLDGTLEALGQAHHRPFSRG